MSNLNTNRSLMNSSRKEPWENKEMLTLEKERAVLNIYESFTSHDPKVSIRDIAQVVTTTIGIDRAIIFKIIRDYKHAVPKVRRRRKCIDEFNQVKNAIYRIVHDIFLEGRLPTIGKVLAVVNENDNLPQFKKADFYMLLKSMRFRFVDRNIFIEKEKTVLWRRQYLRAVRKYRQEGRKIYYLGETWISSENVISEMNSSEHVRELKNETRKAMVVCHIGSSVGFVKEGLWVFHSKKSQNCEEAVSNATFEHWFMNVLPHLEDNSVIVMDNAPYHSRKVGCIPTAATERVRIEQWLTERQIQFNENLLKVELLDIIHAHKSKYNKYVCEELAQEHNRIVLRLPPYHNELNPIVRILTQLKNGVAACNVTCKFSDICEAVNSITHDKWKECVDYVCNTVEPWMWELDSLIESRTDFTKYVPSTINIQ